MSAPTKAAPATLTPSAKEAMGDLAAALDAAPTGCPWCGAPTDPIVGFDPRRRLAVNRRTATGFVRVDAGLLCVGCTGLTWDNEDVS